jgi:hypothetical protein
MEKKFNVGDKVRIVENMSTSMLTRITGLPLIGAEGVIVEVENTDGPVDGYIVSTKWYDNMWVAHEWLELVEPEPEDDIEFEDFDGITITLKYNGSDLDIESDVDLNPIENVDAIYGAIDALLGLLGAELND